jgi:hypothetical protein
VLAQARVARGDAFGASPVQAGACAYERGPIQGERKLADVSKRF